MDVEKPNPNFSYYEKYAEKNYLTDEHKSFIKLPKKYNLEMYNCFVHLIRIKRALHNQINQLTKGSKGLPFRLEIICKYIIDRTKRINISVFDIMKNYITKLKKKVENSWSVQNHTFSRCNCAKKLYFSQLYAMDVPYIHDIQNGLLDESLLYETIRFNSPDFLKNRSYYRIRRIWNQYEFEIQHKASNNNNNTGNSETSSTLAFNPDYEDENDQISYLIAHTECQLATLIKRHNINLAISRKF